MERMGTRTRRQESGMVWWESCCPRSVSVVCERLWLDLLSLFVWMVNLNNISSSLEENHSFTQHWLLLHDFYHHLEAGKSKHYLLWWSLLTNNQKGNTNTLKHPPVSGKVSQRSLLAWWHSSSCCAICHPLSTVVVYCKRLSSFCPQSTIISCPTQQWTILWNMISPIWWKTCLCCCLLSLIILQRAADKTRC